MAIYHGDCLETLRTMPDASVDSIVTDPPYGLSFMGKRWDYDVPSEEIWRECLRVLKPGGHLLAFAGTRTQHRMAVRIEDAGFEIRDMIAWVYGSGFPKSLDVSKAIDKRGGNPGLTAEIGAAIKAARESRGMSASECDRLFCGGTTNWSWFEGRPVGQRAPTPETFANIAKAWPELSHLADAVAEVEREVIGQKRTCDPVAWYAEARRGDGLVDITAPATPEAQQWAGWGTALKPALEPITVARKPLIGTVAANVLEHGTGALNVDGCRVDGVVTTNPLVRNVGGFGSGGLSNQTHPPKSVVSQGRWPANLIHDGSDEVVRLFPQSTAGTETKERGKGGIWSPSTGTPAGPQYGDTGSAARFFYCAKASKKDRDEGLDMSPDRFMAASNQAQAQLKRGIIHEAESGVNTVKVRKNNHPTVKPTALMRYLCRLVTPLGGTVLDPFMGSGSTGKAAVLEGFNFVGIEREAEYVEIAKARIAAAEAKRGEMLPMEVEAA
jgi:DNA modification methylase